MLEIATEIAKKAGSRILDLEKKILDAHKGGGKDLDFLTEADLVAQKLIVEALRKNFPNHGIVAEEDNVAIDENADYLWAVDPLDGTLAFSHGLPFWGVSLGLLHKHHPVLGVIFIPELHELFWVEKGKGSFFNGQKIRVSPTKTIGEALVYLSVGPHSMRATQLKLGERLLRECGYLSTFGSAVAGLASVAAGRVDVYLPSKAVSIWDVAAGALLVEEAGGRVSDFSGNPIDWTARRRFEFLATNGLVHEEVLGLLVK